MHNHRSSLLFSALAASLALTLSPASAQTSGASGNPGADTNRSSATAAHSKDTSNKADRKAETNADEAWQRTHRASKIIGTEVRNGQDQKVGTIKDLVLEDPQSGRISQVVIAVGGVLGMGDKLFAVPYEEIQVTPGQKHVVLNGGNDLAQTFDEKHWPQSTKQTASTTSDRSSGVAMSPVATPSSAPTSGVTANGNATSAEPSSSAPSSSASASSATAPSSSTSNTSGGAASSSTDASNAGASPSSSTPPAPTTSGSNTSSSATGSSQ